MRNTEEDFASFVVGCQARLQQTAWLLIGDWPGAEDLVQVALMKTWAHWDRINADDPYGYARRVLLNTFFTRLRRRWRTEVPHPEPADHPAADDLADRIADRLTVAHVLVRVLTPRQRAVVVVRYFDDLSEAQTADVLGMAVGTVKSTAAAALAKLRTDGELGMTRTIPGRGEEAEP